MSRCLTVNEVAVRLRISRATAARLINEGLLPAIVLAQRQRRRLLRVSEDALERYMQRSAAAGNVG